MRKPMVSECMSLDGVIQAPVAQGRGSGHAVADQIGAAGGAAEAAQVDAWTPGQSSAMEAVIGGGAGRRSHRRQQGRQGRTPEGRRPER